MCLKLFLSSFSLLLQYSFNSLSISIWCARCRCLEQGRGPPTKRRRIPPVLGLQIRAECPFLCGFPKTIARWPLKRIQRQSLSDTGFSLLSKNQIHRWVGSVHALYQPTKVSAQARFLFSYYTFPYETFGQAQVHRRCAGDFISFSKHTLVCKCIVEYKYI